MSTTASSSSSNSSKNVFQTVLKFMQDCNRPYSINDICERIGKEYTKSAVIKWVRKQKTATNDEPEKYVFLLSVHLTCWWEKIRSSRRFMENKKSLQSCRRMWTKKWWAETAKISMGNQFYTFFSLLSSLELNFVPLMMISSVPKPT
jgi:hypothetical protein